MDLKKIYESKMKDPAQGPWKVRRSRRNRMQYGVFQEIGGSGQILQDHQNGR